MKASNKDTKFLDVKLENNNEIKDNLEFDKLCHIALSILISKRIEAELYHKERKVCLAVSKEELCERLKINKEELFVVTSILKDAQEIDLYAMEFDGYFAKPKGIYSYGDKKYLKKRKLEKRENTKYYIQVIIPVATVIIAFLSIMLNISQWKYSTIQKTSEIELKKQMESIHKELNSLKESTKNKGIFSLKNEQPTSE